MRYFQTVEEIFDFAITLEEYTRVLAGLITRRATDDEIKLLTAQFVEDEDTHINTLHFIKQNNGIAALHKAVGLKIADYLVFSDPPDYSLMKYKDILSMAIKNETACIKLYSRLAKLSNEDTIQKQLLVMADEEAKHRHALQREYDKNVRKG